MDTSIAQHEKTEGHEAPLERKGQRTSELQATSEETAGATNTTLRRWDPIPLPIMPNLLDLQTTTGPILITVNFLVN
jgi:hypothetical protein